jgi:hypothetical protein
VDINVPNGVVTLAGEVPNARVKADAEAEAGGVNRVVKVVNDRLSTASLGRNSTRARQPEEQEHEEERREDEGEHLGDREGSSRDPRETEQSGHEADHEKRQRPLDHGSKPPER